MRPPAPRSWHGWKLSPHTATEGRSAAENASDRHNLAMAAPTIELLWPDGTLTTGRSWREVEDAVRAQQWHTFRNRRAFRAEMRRRAEVWSGHGLPPLSREANSRAFLRQLADAEMFQLVRS
jgi:hypothetical protein